MTFSSLENNPPPPVLAVLLLLLTFSLTGGVVGEDAGDPSSLADVAVDDTMKDGAEILGSTNSFMGIVPFLDVPHM
jgi:hypothetical protein